MEQVQTEIKETIEATSESIEQKQEIDVDALMARLEKLESTNSRLLDESKTNKSKYQNLRSEVDTQERVKLEESENWKELLDIEKNKAFELQEQNKKIKYNVLQNKLNYEVARQCPTAYDVTDVIGSLPKDLLQIDEENLKIDGIREAVEHVMKSKPHLFNTGIKPHGQEGAPPAEYKQEIKETSLAELLLQGSKEGII